MQHEAVRRMTGAPNQKFIPFRAWLQGDPYNTVAIAADAAISAMRSKLWWL
jgi:hypothetical protein